jgi:hypothetical protein
MVPSDRGVRAAAAAALIVLLGTADCSDASSERAVPAGATRPPPVWAALEACRLPPRQLTRILAGYRPGRSGDVQFVPRPRNYFDEHSHSGPWGYLQRVPLLVYGPGQVPAAGVVRRPVTLSQVAPTVGAHVGLRPNGGDASPLNEAVRATSDVPRLVAVVVWDGGGRIVLGQHPVSWPVLRSLRPAGVWYSRATVGSSPSVSPAVHASLSTGLPPADHGLVDMVFRTSGRIVRVDEDPSFLLAPTVADRYDRRRGNRPVVALVGHPLIVSMLGQGSGLPGADRDIALIEGEAGWIPPVGGDARFRFPLYVQETFHASEAPPEPSATARFASFQTRTIARLVRREGMGADAVPDLLLVNYNQINEVGHHWGVHGRPMAAAVRSTDRALGRLIRLLDRAAGVGEWVLFVMADHGSTPDASVTGSFRINSEALARDLRTRFDHDGDGTSAIASIRVTQLWVRRGELAEEGFHPDDVARFLQGYTEADNQPGGADVPVFSAAFTSDVLSEMEGRSPCGEAGD